MTKKGQKVKAHYKGTLDDGTVFDSSYDRGEPIEFAVGTGQMIPGFDAAVLEMEAGEKRTIHIPAEDAYGPRNESMIIDIPVGAMVMIVAGNGAQVPLKLIGPEDGKAIFDGNHELAGEALNFDIEVISAE